MDDGLDSCLPTCWFLWFCAFVVLVVGDLFLLAWIPWWGLVETSNPMRQRLVAVPCGTGSPPLAVFLDANIC
jgi:hypothetical protein